MNILECVLSTRSKNFCVGLSMRAEDVFADIDEFCVEPVDVYLSQSSISWPMTENQVVTVFYNTVIPLKQFVALCPCTSHLSKRLTAVTVRFASSCPGRAPSAQVFGSSMVVFMGATDERITLYYVHQLRKILSKLNLPRPPRNGRLFSQNKVCSGCYDYCLDLENFEKENRLNVVGDKSSFPGIVFMVPLPGSKRKLSLSLFSTGKYNIMGVYQDQAIRGFTYVLEILRRNRADGNIRMKADRNIKKIRAALEAKSANESYLTCVRRALSTIDDDYEDSNYDNENQLQKFREMRQAAAIAEAAAEKQRATKRRRT